MKHVAIGSHQAQQLPDGWSISDFAARSFGGFQESQQDVVLRFLPAAANDAARFLFHPTQRMEPQADGSLILRLTAGGLQEIVYHLFTWGTTVEVLEPASLRQKLRDFLETALTHHGNEPNLVP